MSLWILATLPACAVILAALVRLGWHLVRLPALPAAGAQVTPGRVCLCMPARDEAADIGPALASWLAQDLPDLAIVVVDDASSDATPAILAGLAAAHPERLRVLRNEVLPPGWLGKNHALHLAVQQEPARTADWLLFVDANVHASPDLLRRAFSFLAVHPADILSLTFRLDGEGLSERLFANMLWPLILVLVPPHRTAEPGHWACCGAGGFILVARRAYEAVQGHAGAPLESFDDIGLAVRVKQAGFVNRLAQGSPMLHLRMYRGLADLLRSSRKSLATPGWRWLPWFLVVTLYLDLAPLWLALAGRPVLGLGLLLLVAGAGAWADRRLNQRPPDPYWIAWPALGFIGAWGMAAAFLDGARGRNTWRGRSVQVR